MRKTELSEIKAISIEKFLQEMNVKESYKTGKEIYYCSPIRAEADASFAVDPVKNLWFDHGADKGGDIIALVMALWKIEFEPAVQMLQQIANNPSLIGCQTKAQLHQAPEAKEYKSTLTMVKVAQLVAPALQYYLAVARKINLPLVLRSESVKAHLAQIHYKVEGRQKEYYSLGWRNQADAYELRSASFKGFIGKQKTFTFIKGTKPGIAIFEGFIDYLSALTYYQVTSLAYDILILNSTRLAKSCIEIVKAQPAIHLFLNNDATGKKLVTYYQQECKGIELKDQSDIYKDYVDFNDLLTKTPPKKPLPGASKDVNSLVSQNKRWWLWIVYKEMQFTNDGTGFEKFTFYSYNNHESGLEQLKQLRQSLEHKTKYFRLCERTTGRDFKVLEEGFLG